MKAVALQSTSQVSTAKKPQAAVRPVPVSPSFNQPVSTIDHLVIQRKPVCACGGGCPSCQDDSPHLNIQTKLAVNAPGDQYEQEADRVADQVMQMDAPAPNHRASGFTKPADSAVHRKCAECQDEDSIQIKRSVGQVTVSGNSRDARSMVNEALRSPSQPLGAATRALMEPRFGHDFSEVRVHTDHVAARSAESVDAEAYTVGSDVVFGAGRYEPASRDGQHLLAHELAHVAQQRSEVQRMTLGHGKPSEVELDDVPFREVPENERGRVNAAIERVRKVAKDPNGYTNCHKMFAETCPKGTNSSLESAFDTAVLWRFQTGTRRGSGAITICFEQADSKMNRRNIGYADAGYGGGEASLAFDLLHELGHVCGIDCPSGPPHYMADKLALYCMGPQEHNEDNQLTFRFGRSTEDWALILSYGWLLHEWRAGRLSLRMNADINVLGGLQGIKEAAGDRAPAGEIAGATFDLRARPFSGEHFGGLSFHAGVGGQFGRFLVRAPTGSDPADIRSDAALVVEVGSRIEWWVKDESATDPSGEPGRVKPRALDFSLRAIQPATTGARRAHEFLISYVYHL